MTPLKGTLFYRSHVPMVMWFYTLYLFSIDKNGINAKELSKIFGVTQQTAWSMLKRVRNMIIVKNYATHFNHGGTEIDDSHFSGNATNPHK